MKNNDDAEYLIQNKMRTILFKKKLDADEQKNLRTILIIPVMFNSIGKIR